MEAKVLYISKSGKSATIAVISKLGKINTSVSGFVGINEGEKLEVGDTFELPGVKKVIVEPRTSEEGEVFNFLRFE